jgi:hypothetical protein
MGEEHQSMHAHPSFHAFFNFDFIFCFDRDGDQSHVPCHQHGEGREYAQCTGQTLMVWKRALDPRLPGPPGGRVPEWLPSSALVPPSARQQKKKKKKKKKKG